MKKGIMILVVCIGLFLGTFQAADAVDNSMSIQQFQNVLISYAQFLGRTDLLDKLLKLDAGAWQVLYDSFDRKGEFAGAVTKLTQSQQMSRIAASAPIVQGMATEFTPNYPSGPLYDTFVFTLIPLFLSDENGSGATNDDRCKADPVAATYIVIETARSAAILAQTLCDTLVVIAGEGTNAPACIAAGIALGVVQVSQIILDQCAYQDGNVDSAEIEAAYQNTRQIIGTVNQIDQIVEEMQDQQDQMRELQIEKYLYENSNLVMLFLPSSGGGILEEVQALVLKRMTQMEMAGISIGVARKFYMAGVNLLNTRSYKLAFDNFAKAYRSLTSLL